MEVDFLDGGTVYCRLRFRKACKNLNGVSLDGGRYTAAVYDFRHMVQVPMRLLLRFIQVDLKMRTGDAHAPNRLDMQFVARYG